MIERITHDDAPYTAAALQFVAVLVELLAGVCAVMLINRITALLEAHRQNVLAARASSSAPPPLPYS